MWGQDAQDDLIFYRHVNAVYKTVASTQIFDLAMEEYKPGFPQRLISKHQATALLFSNIGIEKLKKDNIDGAIHYLTLISINVPKNPDMWINLGAAYKHIGQLRPGRKDIFYKPSLLATKIVWRPVIWSACIAHRVEPT